MKKLLLIASAFLLAVSSMSAQVSLKMNPALPAVSASPAKAQAESNAGSLWYSYCGAPYTAVGNGACYIAGVMGITASTAAEFTGNTIDKVRLAVSLSKNTEVTIFLTNSLNQDPFYTQKVTLAPGTWSEMREIALTTPYTFDGKAVYIGYTLRATSDSDYPIVVDGQAASYNSMGDIVGISTTSSSTTSMSYQHIGSMFGNVCIEALISGTFPAVNPVATQLRTANYVGKGKPFAAWFNFQNLGTDPISSITLSQSFGDGAAVTKTVNLPEPMAMSAEVQKIYLTGLTLDTEGTTKLKCSIDAVNGTALPEPIAMSADVRTVITQNPLMMVVEEGTAQTCGYCPRGIMGFEYMNKNYKDYFIGIAAHVYFSGTYDNMGIKQYDGLLNYISGLPGCQVNRNSSYTTTPSYTELENCYLTNFNTGITGAVGLADISFAEAEYTTVERTGIKAKTKSMFAEKSSTANRYRTVYVMTENKVGPYRQSNNFAGQAGYGDWTNYGSSVEWLYDDVARWISSYTGNATVFPSSIVAGDTYTEEIEIPIADLKNANGKDMDVNPDNIEVIAMIVSSSPRSIVAATRLDMNSVIPNTTTHAQKITWDQEFETYYDLGATVELTAKSSMDLPITYTVTEGADLVTLDGNLLTFNSVGTVTVMASQAGAENVLPATPVSRSIACKKNQEIIWDQDFTNVKLNEPITLTATATSGLPISYSSKKYNKNAKVSKGVLTFTDYTTAVIVAKQTGDTEYAPAASVEREIVCADSGIESITADKVEGSLLFDLNGIHVTNPEPGKVYIMVTGDRGRKVVIK